MVIARNALAVLPSSDLLCHALWQAKVVPEHAAVTPTPQVHSGHTIQWPRTPSLDSSACATPRNDLIVERHDIVIPF